MGANRRNLLFLGLLGLCFWACPITYRGYQHVQGQVVAADTGVALRDARVVACLVDRHPGGRYRDCASTPWRTEVATDNDGRFQIEETWHFAVALPLPGGMPTYAINLLVTKDGYTPKELSWHDRGAFAQQPLVIPLEPSRPDLSN